MHEDVLFVIFSFLELDFVLTISTVSKLFHKTSQKEVLYQQQLDKFLTKKPKKFSNQKIEINWKHEYKKRKFKRKFIKYDEKKIHPLSFLSKDVPTGSVRNPTFVEQNLISNKIYSTDVCYVSSVHKYYFIDSNSKIYLMSNFWGIDITNQSMDLTDINQKLHELSLNTNESTEKYFDFRPMFHLEIINFIEKRYLSELSLIYLLKMLLIFQYSEDVYDISIDQKSKMEILQELLKKKILWDLEGANFDRNEKLEKFEMKEERNMFEMKFFVTFLFVSTIGYVHVKCCCLLLKVDADGFSIEEQKIWEHEVDDF
eukprot:gene3997-7253_t